MEPIRWIASLVVPALAGFVGVITGAWLTARRENRQRKLQFITDQLRLFYSPMLGIRSEIQTRSELRTTIHSAADSAWRELCERTQQAGPEALQELTSKRAAEFTTIIDYDNQKWREELLPAYEKMVTIFRENLWLADPETRTYFGELLRFVDVWRRWLARALPREVLMKLDHGEAALQPFYEHLQHMHDQLRRQLAQGGGEQKRRSLAHSVAKVENT
jgi:hypothetical protein